MGKKIKAGLMVFVVAIAVCFSSSMAPSAAENQQAAVEERADIDKEALNF